MKTIAVLIVSLVLIAVYVPVAHADNHPLVVVVSNAEYQSQEYAEFVRIFNATLIAQVNDASEQKRLSTENHWAIFLSPVLSPYGQTLIMIFATLEEEKSGRSILIGVLGEGSDAATVRTAAKSVQRLIVETATATRQREVPPPPTQPQEPKTKNLRTKQRAEVSHFLWYRRRI